MREKDCWNKFAVSGKVEDYLKYRNSIKYITSGTQALLFTAKPEIYSDGNLSISKKYTSR